jgi:phosphoadenosine phosphosulfate reductase
MPDLEQKAIERLKLASEMSFQLYEQPLVITYSGGKDSEVILRLAQASGIPFEVLHSLTTADAPETVYHVLDTFKRLEEQGVKCAIDKHDKPDGTRTTMWNLIPRNGIPSRKWRFCCKQLKETGGKDRFIVTGVRWSESESRKTNRGTLEVVTRKKENKLILSNDNAEDRRLFESCQLAGKRVVNPIVDWKDADIWDYIRTENICINPLYQCGFERVGCVGCPLASKRIRKMEFGRYPKYKAMYIRAFDKMLIRRKQRGVTNSGWETAEDVFHWWMEDGVLPGQIEFEMEEKP